MESEIINSPDCVSDNKQHTVISSDSPFYFECIDCFERFILLSETVAKKTGLNFKPKEDKK